MSAAFLLRLILLIPLVGCVFTAAARDVRTTKTSNPLYVAMLSLLTNIVLIVGLFSPVGHDRDVSFSIAWPLFAETKLTFEANRLSLLPVLALHLSVFAGMLWGRPRTQNAHRILFLNLLCLWSVSACFLAADPLTHLVFFVLAVVPVGMQCGLSIKAESSLLTLRFVMQNIFFACVLIGTSIILWAQYPETLENGPIPDFAVGGAMSYWAGVSLFVVFLSRLPLWPLAVSWRQICRRVDHPIVLINLFWWPVTGLYALMINRPEMLIKDNPYLSPIVGILCLLSMFRAALDVLQNASLIDRVIDTVTIYLLLYLVAVCLPTDVLTRNIGYSVFAFGIVAALLAVSAFHLARQRYLYPQYADQSATLMPKTALVYTGAVLSAIGLPLTPLFWNNFMILSAVMDVHLVGGGVIVVAMMLMSVGLMNTLYMMRQKNFGALPADRPLDLDDARLLGCVCLFAVLFLSLIQPLWFVM
jgi:NADH:ubiquinone oxidoreductase subunit 4 (subunit M)